MMVDQVIGSILEAEARADEIVKEANFRAKADLSARGRAGGKYQRKCDRCFKKIEKREIETGGDCRTGALS